VKVGDMIEMVGRNRWADNALDYIGVLISVDRRHGADCNRHSKVATVLTSAGNVATWPLDSYNQVEVLNESR
jgi:hypothetical protein